MNTLYELFRGQAERAPDALALTCGGVRVSYAALEARSSRLACSLQRNGIARGALVAIRLRHSPDLIAALLALARSGAAYVGIDPAWPLARAREVLEDARPTALLADDFLDARALQFEGRVLVPSALEGDEGAAAAPTPAQAHDLFSVVYTSGTTGRPKGVLVTVQSVLNRLEWMWSAHPFRSRDLALVYRPYTTVGFSWDCFGALLQGVPTVISTVTDVREAVAVAREAERCGVTHCTGSVGFWDVVLDHAERHAPFWTSLRVARCSGEALPPATVVRWRRTFPNARLLNIYGATECSGSTALDTSAFEPTGETRVPVGSPVPGVEVLVVGDDGRPVAAGEMGEIWIGGASLAQGYLGDPKLTAERYVSHPLRSSHERVFRTGDLGVWRPDGLLEVVGRRDLQVKVRGYRVEIEDVEAALRRCPAVRAAAVHPESDRGNTRLVAFVVPASQAFDAAALRADVADRLPSYMVPAEFVVMEALPLTRTGKLDRSAFAALPRSVRPPAADDQSPRTATEAAVASVWSEVLGLADIARDEDFFDIGGHSLSGVQIVSRLQDAFGIEIPLQLLFDHPSIGALAAEIERVRASAPAADGCAAAAAAGSGPCLS